MVDPFSATALFSYPLDEASELRELDRERGKLATIARCKAIICSPEARQCVVPACWLALSTNLPEAECIKMLRYLAGADVNMLRRGRELRAALEIGATEAAAVLGFCDAEPDERAAA
jgi:hypothetical protein